MRRRGKGARESQGGVKQGRMEDKVRIGATKEGWEYVVGILNITKLKEAADSARYR